MKKLAIVFTVCLMLMALTPVFAMEPFHYESDILGFSITVPNLSNEELTVEEHETSVCFFHAPSHEKGDGLIGSIEVVSPRSKFFSEEYTNMAYQIIAMGEDRIFLWKSPSGGVNTSREMVEAFAKVASALSIDRLKECLKPLNPDDQPILNATRHLKYLTAENNQIRPDVPLTRGELAEMLYALVDASNKNANRESLFADVVGKPCAKAVDYLASYGILGGYTDGTFRPDDSVSRAQFAVLLHRFQFASPMGQYGETASFADVSNNYWAAEYIHSANILGWMSGYSDRRFYPNREITRAQAVVTINRMLGRDESHTDAEKASNPFSDLDAEHWAYKNILEACGILPGAFSESFKAPSGSLPKSTSIYYFADETNGWAISERQLYHTTNGGKRWDQIGEPFSFAVSDVFFFNDQDGLLLGCNKDTPFILLQTTDGGRAWSDFLADSNVQGLHLPVKQFPTEKSMLGAIVSAEFRAASANAVYLTIQYHPYESIYVLNFKATKQTTITMEELHSLQKIH